MKLIVGLGNPGKEYVKTRHNIGYDLIDFIANHKGYQVDKKKFNALYAEEIINNEKVIIIKPLTYMNLSGQAVLQFVNYYHIDPQDILIIQDDLDMRLGKIKIVQNSSSGGHNGIKNIESLLNTSSYVRVKIGISKDNKQDIRDYVLSSFDKEEDKKIINCYEKLVDIIDDFCTMNVSELQNKYNNK